MFSFKDGNIQNPILSRVKKEALWYALGKDNYGPRFGFDEFKMKSVVSDFTQDKLNYEVFKVVEKSI
ncbi:hypothetical protein Glove_217g29 [Diversispora epigaea]|uniref:Uncharacterized protein n=1 Tax=Diversispora epigaea TaxID=1348612 RepID=A0A397IPI3_9GLOM|nr:hypothetical protein Glove_217g29 [Diversispora epigaea]